MSVSVETYETIRSAILQWPADMRFALLRDLLDTLSPADRQSGGAGMLSQARGLLAVDAPPLSDEQVKKWLDQHRQEKYG